MNKIVLALCALGLSLSSLAQTDSTGKDTTGMNKRDTIRVGGITIIKYPGSDTGKNKTQVILSRERNRYKKPSNVSTNWWVVDLGFANINDNSNYIAATTSGFVAPGVGADQFELRTGKSVNVNIWLFWQRLNLIKHVVNLKYGLGVELNNYRFDDERVRFAKNPTRISLDPTLQGVKKNKLAADYVTVPVMLNFNFRPGYKNAFGFSGGISAGYLYSARQKIKEGDDKDKLNNDFDLERWKLSYIGEISLGIVRLYGSYAINNMWDRGLNQRPYNVGIRLSRW